MTPEQAGAAVHALSDAFQAGDVDAAVGRFATDGEVLYAGSESGEVAVGLPALRSLLTEVLARDERYSWRCDSVRVVACSTGFAVLAEATLFVHPDPEAADAGGSQGYPYRVSGLLEDQAPDPDGVADWRWRFCQGSEPTPPAAT